MREKWKGKPPLRFILDWYDAWLRCDVAVKVCATLEIPANRLHKFMSYPELKLARELADQRRGTTATFSGYIHKSLSKEAKEAWDKCQFWENCENSFEQIERILNSRSKTLRQELFLHALVRSNFDVSEAMRMVAVRRTTYSNWVEDPEFRQLIQEIQWHKKNFFERALVDLVEMRHPSAVLFVNRTINADRGYGEKSEVTHNVGSGIRIEELDLDADTMRKILEAVRRKKQQALLGPDSNKAMDVSSEVKMVEDRNPPNLVPVERND